MDISSSLKRFIARLTPAPRTTTARSPLLTSAPAPENATPDRVDAPIALVTIGQQDQAPSVHLAWSSSTTNEAIVRSFTNPPGEGSIGALFADCYDALYGIASGGSAPTRVHVTDQHARRQLASVAHALPLLELGPLNAEELTRLRSQLPLCATGAPCEGRHDGRSDDPQASLPGRRKATKPLTVATDASARRNHRGAGIAWLLPDGRCGFKYLTGVSDITTAELYAIRFALTSHRGRTLHIRTDSQSAIRWISSPATAPSRAKAQLASQVSAMLSANNCTLSWVKGHSCDSLNEGADRLAVAARRHHELGVEPGTARMVIDQIIADLTSQFHDASLPGGPVSGAVA